MTLKIIKLIVLLAALHCGHATQRCNIMKMAISAQTCFQQFWPDHMIHNHVTFEPNATQIVTTIMEQFGLNKTEVNENLNRIEILGNNDSAYDTLSKMIETTAIAEPYILYGVADLLLGFKVTPNEISRFGLPASLTERSTLKDMYSNYLELVCARKPLAPLVECLNKWMTENCDAQNDNLEFIQNYISTAIEYYCSDSSIFKRDNVKSEWDADLGNVWVDLATELGIYKNNSENNPYLFNIDREKISTLEDFRVTFNSECGYLIEAQTTGFPSYFKMNSTVGTGTVIKELHELGKTAIQCGLRTFSLVKPGFLDGHPKMINHLYYTAARFGFERKDIKWGKIELGSVRVSVTCYGDPHLLVYKRTDTVTCPARGIHEYLTNQYFSLHALSEEVAPGSNATYATSVTLVFRFNGSFVSYATDATGLSQALIKPGNHLDEEKINIMYDAESGVTITDMRSGAVFVINQIFGTYLFTARLGSDLMDNSVGLLVTGCRDQVDISPSARRKRATNDECEAACLAAPERYRDSCVFDCTNLDNLQAADIVTSVVAQQKVVSAPDEQIIEMFPTEPPVTGSASLNLMAKALLGLTTLVLLF